MIFIKKNKNKMINLKWQDTRELKYVRKGFKFMKRLGSTILAILFLLVTASSGLIFAQGDAVEPERPYEVFQDFEDMESQEDLGEFMGCSIDEVSQATLSLSADGGYQNSKAAKIEFTKISYWMEFLDPANDQNRYHAKKDGFSFWIKTDQPIDIRLYVYDEWREMECEPIALTAGEHFVQVPWTSVVDSEGGTVRKFTNNALNRVMLKVSGGVSGAGAIYIDEIGYYEAEEEPSEPAIPGEEYELMQDFEDMSSQEDLEDFMTVLIDEDSEAILSLAEGKGYLGSKAARIEYSCIKYWMNFLDPDADQGRYYAKGEGFSFWIKTDREIDVQLYVLDDWVDMHGERITLSPGEHFVQVPWSSVKGSDDETLTVDPENSLQRLKIKVFNSEDVSGNIYIDELGYYPKPEEPYVPAEPAQPYGVYQDFEEMNTQEDLDNFMMAEVDEDGELTLSLSEDGGYQNSKAAKIEYTRALWWMKFLDENYQAQHYIAAGDGFSIWLKTDNEIRIRLYVFDDWVEMRNDYITLTPGEHFVQFPWSDFKGVDDDGNEVTLKLGEDNTIQSIQIEVEGGISTPGTIYIDEIGYVNYEMPTEPEKPPLPDDESVVLFCATRGASPWPNIQGDPAYCDVFRVFDDPRFDFYFKLSLLEDFSKGGIFIYNNLTGEGDLEPADISYAYEKGYVRFWVKASAAKSFDVYFSAEGEVPSEKTTITVDEPNVWQEFRLPMSTFPFKNAKHAEKVYHFCISGKDVEGDAFGAGDVIKIAGIKVYSQEPEEIEVEDGLDNDPENNTLKYPVGTKDDSAILWFTDTTWPFDLSGGAGEITIEDESVLEGFDKIYKWVLGENFKNAYQGAHLYGDTADVTNYIDTAYLRFYVKSSKAGKIMLALKDDAYVAGPRFIVEIEKANEWTEVRIPLARFIGFQDIEYINSVFISDVYKPYSWSYGDDYDGEIINTGEGYLEAGDTLYFSPFIIKAGAGLVDDDDDDDDYDDEENGTKTPPTGEKSPLPLALVPFGISLIAGIPYKKIRRRSCQQ